MQIHSGFLGPGATWDPLREATPFRLRGCHPLCRTFPGPSTITRLSDSLLDRQTQLKGPTTPNAQRLPAITHARFGLIRFRSPLLTEYLFLPVLRCFTSRRSLHTPYIFRCGSHDMTRAGFPHSEILGSRFVCQLPEAYRRLLRPSSAPGAKASTLCTYKLDHKDHSKMLASTVQFSSNHRPPPSTPAPTPPRPPPEGDNHDLAVRPDQTAPTKATPPTGCSLRTQQRAKPTPTTSNPVPSPQQAAGVLGATDHRSRPVVDVPPVSTTPHTLGEGMGLDTRPPHDRATSCQMLLRKEVIQPHLPVRLPCYDLVLIASPTFDDSPLTVGPSASGVTDFHDLTGGVYKARERIHRSVADLRLLATPTSWGRVADPNPN